MKITVKLFATLREYNKKEFEYEVSDNSTIKEVIEELKLPLDDIAIMMVNGRSQKLEYTLVAHDVLALFPPVGGG
jgi:molybdopterin converting factor small subunit